MSFPRGRGRGRGLYVHNPPRSLRPKEQIHTPESKPSHSQAAAKPTCEHSNMIAIDLNLDHPSEQWFTTFRNSWNMLKKCDAVKNMLVQHFEICVNPYEQALRLMYNSVDFKHSKPKSLANYVMEVFAYWSATERNRIIHLLTQPLKITAFNVVRQQSLFSLMKLVAQNYEMAKDCDIFLGVINHMILQKQYKEACQSAALLGLHSKFNIDQFLLPLILQDKLNCAEEFLADSPSHQSEVVTFLDSMLGQPMKVRSAMENYILTNDIVNVKWDKLHYKPWRKLITRLVKAFSLSDDVTPFLNKRRNEGALQFLLNKRYTDQTFGEESWREMVQEAVKDEPHLHLELVGQVAAFGDVEESLRWAHFYSVPKEDWPYSVRMLNDNPELNRQHQQINAHNEESWDSPTQTDSVVYHKLKLSESNIHLVDNEPSFEDFLDHGLMDINIIGMDCEWKPSFGGRKNELALMQLSTRKGAYVIDTIALGSKVPHLWQELSKFLFNNCDILKLGFGFVTDMSMIRHSLPHLNFNQKQVGFLDLQTLWKHLEKTKMIFPFEVQEGGLSLNTLVQKCLGAPLDKSDQFSNWEKRPLRPSQMIYASLDAYCLIEIYDVLKQCCERANLNYDDICYSVMTNASNEKKRHKKPAQKKPREKSNFQHKEGPNKKTVPADSMKLVCDTMLQGLGKSLRRCGIDTTILANHQDHMDCVMSYYNEARYILTRGAVYDMLAGSVPAGFCLKIMSDNIDEQLEEVLDYYKIKVNKSDVFSVCQLCNGKNFVKVGKETMKNMGRVSFTPHINHTSPEYEELADEAAGFSSDDDLCEEPPCPANYTLPQLRNLNTFTESSCVDRGMTNKGTKIQYEAVPPQVIEKVEAFYICEDCGKVYWDGSHLERILAGRLQAVVNK